MTDGKDKLAGRTPHRFRTKRQFWAYCGLALEMRDSGEYRVVGGQVERRKKPAQIRGLNWNHNHELKNLFKAAATSAAACNGVFQEFYLGLLKKNMRAGGPPFQHLPRFPISKLRVPHSSRTLRRVGFTTVP